MATPTEREFGKIPDSAKRGPISLQNYSFRAEAHCAQRADARGRIHPTIERPSAEFSLWRQYFEMHLGGYPPAFERLLIAEPKQHQMTVPEGEPQWFDPSFEPDHTWIERPYVQIGSRPLERVPIAQGEDYYSMVAKYGPPLERVKAKKLVEVIDVETVEQIQARLGITPAQWDAIADAPKDAKYWQGIRSREPAQ